MKGESNMAPKSVCRQTLLSLKRCRHKIQVKKAFTLAELLTAVLVISIIMVALAPVITKR
ncbi:TPA: prepilin-type N-terminal cleavage/methylation domain-containing protein, partial [Candidatus Galligastranaerophilus faecipullorum]|nr:prepilin-type N-terminal cleavage/methylation domain-containing protein [Candidatus Galligastranaerophilus faecipullorum]